MILIGVLAGLLLIGLALVARTLYATWQGWGPGQSQAEEQSRRPGLKPAALSVGRGLAVGVVAGFWVGILMTGPAMRLIMRLLAVTAGPGAQGVVTEADQVVGRISSDNTFGLLVFGGILPGLLSGVVFVAIRRWLPEAWKGGLVFGFLHLLIAATRIDPLRADNIDFDIVGPGWLAVATFGAATIVHGLAVASFANAYSRRLPLKGDRRRRWVTLAVAAPPAALMIPGFFLLGVLVVMTTLATLAWQIPPLVRLARSRAVARGGTIALAALTLLMAPAAIRDLAAIAAG